MAEFTAAAPQTVQPNRNVLFNNACECGCKCVHHRRGSGILTLKKCRNTCDNRYKVSFGANIAIPTGGAVAPISVALAINGKPFAGSTAIVTPAAVENFFNVSLETFVDSPCGCCTQVSVVNTSDAAITVQNANIIVTHA